MTWIIFEGIMLSKKVRERQILLWSHLYIESKSKKKKKKKAYYQRKTKVIDRENRLVVARGGKRAKWAKKVKMYQLPIIK